MGVPGLLGRAVGGTLRELPYPWSLVALRGLVRNPPRWSLYPRGGRRRHVRMLVKIARLQASLVEDLQGVRFASHLEALDLVLSMEALVISWKDVAVSLQRSLFLRRVALIRFLDLAALQVVWHLVLCASCVMVSMALSPPHLATDVLRENLVRTGRLLESATTT